MLNKLLDEEGIGYRFDEHEGYTTDQWAVVIVDGERTPLSYWKVNQEIRTQHIVDHIDLLSHWKMIYVEGFFVSSNFEAIMKIVEFSEEHKINFAFNLCGEYWVETYSDKFINIIPHCDFLFGNNNEISSMAKILGFESKDTEEWVKFVTSYKPSSDKDENQKKQRITLISMDKQGAILDIYKFDSDTHDIILVPSEQLEENQVVDTCWAGDTFVGGFLSGYLNGKEMRDWVIDGHKIAAKVIQNIGWVFE